MNILALLPWYPANAARFLADAIRKTCQDRGYGFFSCGPTYFDHYGLSYQKNELPVVDWEMPRNITWDLDVVIAGAKARGFDPDVILLSEENYQNTIVPTQKIPVVLWSADGWPNCYARREMIKPTLAYTNHPLGVLPHPRTSIPEGWKFLPGGYSKKWHEYYEGSFRGRGIDFCLPATPYGDRPRICEALRSSGVIVHSDLLTPYSYRSTYNASMATYHNCNGQHEIKWRFFEAAAMGCVNICDKNYLLDALDFEPWEDYVPIEEFEKDRRLPENRWPSSEAIVLAVKTLREKSALVRRISSNVQKRIAENDSYTHRVEAIFTDLGIPGEMDFIDYDAILRRYLLSHPLE